MLCSNSQAVLPKSALPLFDLLAAAYPSAQKTAAEVRSVAPICRLGVGKASGVHRLHVRRVADVSICVQPQRVVGKR